ncbi:hypothetical protein BHM03_00013683 [Ensete ventricosum]|nr:hypothetical protein BHM03_00013683 [Ensete ventricosum]
MPWHTALYPGTYLTEQGSVCQYGTKLKTLLIIVLDTKVCNFDLYRPPDTSGTYRSVRLLIHGPPATGRYRQNRPSVVNFGCRRPTEREIFRRRSIEGEIDRRQSIEREIDRQQSIEGEKGKKKKKKRRKKKRRRRTYFPHDVLARAPSLPSPASAFFPTRGDGTSPHTGRKIEATTTQAKSNETSTGT